MSAKISSAGSRLRPRVAAGERGVQRLGALRVADAEVVERRQQLAAVARPAPRVIHSAAIVAAPPPRSRPSAPS